MVNNLFIDISLILVIALVLSYIAKLLKQPLLIAYIATGIIISPLLLNLTKITPSVTIFSEIGIAILLFMVGLNLNPKIIKEIGSVALVAALGQIIITFILGFLISKLIGFSTISSLYMAIAISFSSTIIIMKILSDKNETSTLYGKITIGFLIVQDLVAILILMAMSSLSKGTDFISTILKTILEGAILIIILFAFGFYILPKITKSIAKSQEILLLFSITWALGIASLFYYLGFSIEIGALLAGITLSISPYKLEIGSKIKPLRDFFLLMFFVLLGSQMTFTNISAYALPIIIFLLLIIIGKPLIVMSFMGLLGYTKRNSFLSGLAIPQVSEFSFIIIALAVSLGQIPSEMLSLITIIGIITIGISTYLMRYSNKLYEFLSPYLKIFERKGIKIDEGKYHLENEYDIILIGYNRIGYDLLNSFKKIKKRFLVVDYNPDTILELAKKGIDCRYGDASDSELLNELNLQIPKMIISTIPDFEINSLLLEKIRSVNKKAIVILISHQIDEANKLYASGASYVIMPHFLGGDYASKLIEKHGLNSEGFLSEKEVHLKKIKERKKIGQEHPTHERD